MFEKISKLSIKAYTRCNMRCCFCHQLYGDKYSPKSFEDFEGLEKLLMELPLAETVDVTVTGGEITVCPTVMEDVWKVLRKVMRKREVKFDVCIITNGTNMDIIYDWCKRKLIVPHKTGISWDGLYSASKSRLISGKYNDLYFQDVIKTLGKSCYNESIGVMTAITPMTIKDLTDSYKFCLENGVYNWGYYYIHEADYSNEAFQEEFRKQIETVGKLFIDALNNGKDANYYNWQLLYSRRRRPLWFYRCAKLGNNIHVDYDGGIYPCIYFGDHRAFKLGSLKDGIDKALLKQFEREYMVEPTCSFKTCGCFQCTECPASCFVHNKSLAKRFCNQCSLLKIESEVYDELAKGIPELYCERLWIPKDLMELSLEENVGEPVYHDDSGIASPNLKGVTEWFDCHQL